MPSLLNLTPVLASRGTECDEPLNPEERACGEDVDDRTTYKNRHGPNDL